MNSSILKQHFINLIREWLLGDLEQVVHKGEQINNLAYVLLVFAHMEFLGSFLTGESEPGVSTKNCVEFLKYMAEAVGENKYRDFAYTLTEIYRNGLLHNYMLEDTLGPSVIFADREEEHLSITPWYRNKGGEIKRVFIKLNKGSLHDHFCRATTNLIEDLEGGKHSERFDKRLNEVLDNARYGIDAPRYLRPTKIRKNILKEWEII